MTCSALIAIADVADYQKRNEQYERHCMDDLIPVKESKLVHESYELLRELYRSDFFGGAVSTTSSSTTCSFNLFSDIISFFQRFSILHCGHADYF
jgi:hypothetical protein